MGWLSFLGFVRVALALHRVRTIDTYLVKGVRRVAITVIIASSLVSIPALALYPDPLVPNSIFVLSNFIPQHGLVAPAPYAEESPSGDLPASITPMASDWATVYFLSEFADHNQTGSNETLEYLGPTTCHPIIIFDLPSMRCRAPTKVTIRATGSVSIITHEVILGLHVQNPCPVGWHFDGNGGGSFGGYCFEGPPSPPVPPLAQRQADKGLGNQCNAQASGGSGARSNTGGMMSRDVKYASRVGNPCDASNGNKYQAETDITGSELRLTRSYNSLLPQDLGFGFGWSAPFVKRLELYGTVVQVREGSGRGEPYTCPSTVGACTGDADTFITLSKDSTGYTLTHRSGAFERYGTTGLLQNETDNAGRVTSYAYDTSNKLSTITGPYGHALSFTWNGTHIASVTDGAGTIAYAYDSNNNLTKVTYPNGDAKLYHYEHPSFIHHLTGISYQEVSGSITRYSTYGYDASGKAVLTEHVGGMEKYTLEYNSDTQTTVRDAANTSEVMTFGVNLGVKNLLNKAHQDGKSLTQVFDPNNNLTCKKDEEGRVSTFTYNSTNQKTSETVGLVGDCVSPITTASTRTTTYTYVSTSLNAPTRIESLSVAGGGNKKATVLTYADSRFPTQPTAITQDGYTPSGGAVSRTVTLSYNAFGNVTAIDGPRADVNDLTALSYYTCTTGNSCGELQTITNAKGQTTTYDSYDANGRVLQLTDSNGVRTNYAYDLRGRVSTITVTPVTGTTRTTTYTYNAANNVTSVSFPEGLSLAYLYDAAQKLASVTDNLGNKVQYGYDLKGNKTDEATFDPNGTLVRALETSYDLRNHVSSINNGGSITTLVSDAIGNLLTETDPNQTAAGSGINTDHQYDALHRLFETVNNLNGLTSYGYDVNDKLIQVKAPNNATTSYQYDDLGNLLQEVSPDRGTINYTYDSAGNVKSITDARGITASYTYDVLNRVTHIDYPGTADDIALTYDSNASGLACSNGIGRLCHVTDASGITEHAFDPFGNIEAQRKTENGITYSTKYTYDTADRVTSITYPDNRVLAYTRDALGRVTDVTTTINGVTQTIVSGRTYRADGLPLSQTYGNGLNEIRDYDLKGQLTYQSLGSADTRVYAYDLNGNLTQKQSLPEVGDYQYDALDRLIDETSSDGEHNAFTYDSNGNRVSDLKANGTARQYLYDSNSNRLVKMGNQTIVLDAAGNTISDRNGNRTFTYNNAGQLTSVAVNGTTRASYVYDFNRQRTRKVRTVTNQTTGVTRTVTLVFHYDEHGHLIAETRPDGRLVREHIWIGDELVAQIQRKGTTEELAYVHADHQDAPRLATNAAQTVVWRFESEAFGTGKPETDPDADDSKTNIRLRPGYGYQDGETGYWYLWHRYYDPRTGRWPTSDPIGIQGGVNTYAAMNNNPLRFVDPTGNSAIAEGGAIVGAAFCLRNPQACINGARALGAMIGIGGGAAMSPAGPVVIDPNQPFPPQLPGYVPESERRSESRVPSNILPPGPSNACAKQLADDRKECESSCTNAVTKAACRAQALIRYFICNGAKTPKWPDDDGGFGGPTSGPVWTGG